MCTWGQPVGWIPQPAMVGQACWHPFHCKLELPQPLPPAPAQPIVAVQINRQLLKHSQSGNCECLCSAAGGPRRQPHTGCYAWAHLRAAMGTAIAQLGRTPQQTSACTDCPSRFVCRVGVEPRFVLWRMSVALVTARSGAMGCRNHGCQQRPCHMQRALHPPACAHAPHCLTPRVSEARPPALQPFPSCPSAPCCRHRHRPQPAL